MGRLHLIPDPARLEESRAIADRYHACFEYNDFYVPDLLDDSDALRERVRRYLSLDRDRSADTLHGAFFDVTVHSEDPLIRGVSERRVYQSMNIAKRLGVRGVVFHTGTIPTFFSSAYEENWLRANRAFWLTVCERYPKIEVLMENMFDSRPDLLSALARELRQVPNFGVCLDYSHAGIFGKDPPAWVRSLAPYIRHLHINDHDGKADLHEAVGGGVTDWSLFDRTIREEKINPSVLIETKSLEKWERSAQYMQKSGWFPFAGNGGTPPC